MAASMRPAMPLGRCAETENIVDLAAATRTVAIHYSFSLCLHLAAALGLNGAESAVAAPLKRKDGKLTLEENLFEGKSMRVVRSRG
jgi:hypothetical protein